MKDRVDGNRQYVSLNELILHHRRNTQKAPFFLKMLTVTITPKEI